MKWQKIRQLFEPGNNYEWMVSHAANPFAIPLNENVFRVYFTCRNKINQSHIGFVDIDFENDFAIKQISDKPVLAPGEPGLFDDSGVAMGYLLTANGKQYLYYLGWNLKVTVPWMNSIGLAIYDQTKKQFEKISRAPVLDRSDEDPFSLSYPSVMIEKNIFRMWYGSNLKWGKDQGEMNHVIKYAESTDGIHWKRNNHIAVNLFHPHEYALSKPFVIKENNESYLMWYSYRANGNISTYRIGYAKSKDGLSWERNDEHVGIAVSESGWDAEMICYPFVFDYKESRYMLYNGNGYGQTGFGIAVLEH